MGEDDDKYTKDGTVDHQGNPADRSKTGTWKACPFILGIYCAIHFPYTTSKSSYALDKMLISLNFYQQEMNVAKDWHTMG